MIGQCATAGALARILRFEFGCEFVCQRAEAMKLLAAPSAHLRGGVGIVSDDETPIFVD